MQFFTLIISALAATAIAVPTEPKPTTTKVVQPPAPTKGTHPGQPGGGSYDPCKSVLINAIPQCCAVNVLGLISLDCKARKTLSSLKSLKEDINILNIASAVPTSAEQFRATCKKTGAQPQCCTVPTVRLLSYSAASKKLYQGYKTNRIL